MSGPLPPADLHRRKPRILELPSGTELHRFFKLIYEPIHFDTSRLGRFNAPDGTYGVLCSARAIEGAFAETFPRDVGRTLLAVGVQFNFVRIHKTPAMAAGVTPKLWEMADMVKVLEDWEAEAVK